MQFVVLIVHTYIHANCSSISLADVNECYDTTQPHSCDQICVNTHGSYECLCGHGYGRGVDGHSCYGEFE